MTCNRDIGRDGILWWTEHLEGKEGAKLAQSNFVDKIELELNEMGPNPNFEQNKRNWLG